jgi:RND family efflux transporter MFP subunit
MSTKPNRSSFWIKVLGVLALLVVGVVLSLRAMRPVAKVESVVSDDAVDAEPGSLTVMEKYSMQIKSAVSGRVIAKNFKLDAGASVKEGDILAQLDTSDIDLEIRQAETDLETTKRRIAVGSPTTYLLESAESDLKNSERLFKLGQLAENDYQKVRRQVETLKQALELEKVKNDSELATDQNRVDEMKNKRDKMTIKAPFDGKISVVFAHPGDLIDAGYPIVTVITLDRIVEAKISEENFAGIREGEKAVMTFLPYGEFRYNGYVSKILPTADPETQRHLVDLKVTDIEPEKLIPGITGEVTIEVGRRPAKAIIPRRALLNDSVYVVKDGKVELRPIKKGYLWLTGAEILEGLEPGERVIVEDLDSFRPGESVTVQEIPMDAFTRHK